jgi:FkbM family methyltransferase
MIIQKDGWWVPANDTCGFRYISMQIEDADKVMAHCQKRRTVIQAGGNIGMWPMRLASQFTKVVTAEPDETNFTCLLKNIEGIPNIEAHNIAFGKSFTTGNINVNQIGNMGALSVVPGDKFHVVPIDSLNIDDCDLLQLDVEGYELFALSGATKTIEASWPVICIELNGLSKNYGHKDSDVLNWLRILGYEKKQIIHRDVVFTKEKNNG